MATMTTPKHLTRRAAHLAQRQRDGRVVTALEQSKLLLEAPQISPEKVWWAPNYKDDTANVFRVCADTAETVALLEKSVHECGVSWVNGKCQEGHEFAKEILCGNDFCPTCGMRNSAAHKRRASRIIPMVQQLGDRGLGYFVLEFQEQDRAKFHGADALQEAGRLAGAVYRDFGKPHCPICDKVGKWDDKQSAWVCPTSPKKHGIIQTGYAGTQKFMRGLRRWHFFGDPPCPKCGRPGRWDRDGEHWSCKRHGAFDVADVPPDTVKFHPHLNVLIDSGLLPKADLTALQKELSLALLGEWHAELNADGSVSKLIAGVILHYEFVPGLKAAPFGKKERKLFAEGGTDALEQSRKGRYLHRAKYIMHPNFLSLKWDEELAADLINFRNTARWGDWNADPVWKLDEQVDSENFFEAVQLGQGLCPFDGSPVVWTAKIMKFTKNNPFWRDLGGGYRVWDPGSSPENNKGGSLC